MQAANLVMSPSDLLIVPSGGMRARTPGDQDIVKFILSLNIMYWLREKHGSIEAFCDFYYIHFWTMKNGLHVFFQ